MRAMTSLNSDEGGDQVGWLKLLDRLHVHHRWHNPDSGIDSPMERITWPAITFRERSWDFMPPDIIRPFATSTVGDIIALAHRLGMGWTDLRPGDGIMRAEGGGQSIISTAVRGFGILLQFNFDQSNRDKLGYGRDMTILSVSADKLGFSIIEYWGLHPGGKFFVDPDFDIAFEDANETEAAKQVMHALRIDKAVISKYGEYMEQSGNSLGFSDILGLWAPYMTSQSSPTAYVMKVHRDVDRGPTCSPEGSRVFYLRLQQFEKEGACSEQMLYLLRTYRELKEEWGEKIWERILDGFYDIESESKFRSKIRNLWYEVTDSLRKTHNYRESEFIFQVVASHITQAVEYPELAKAALDDAVQRQKIEEGLEPLMDRQMAAGMHLYIDRIPLIVSLMGREGYLDKRAVIDTWWTLIFRAMIWHRGHRILKGKTRAYGGIPVSPAFWGSKLPVYIV